VQGKMVPMCKLFKNIPLHVQELNYKKKNNELKDHIGEKALNSKLPKFRPTQKK
jgi:hypothetical protein